MSKTEKQFIHYIEDNKDLIFLILISIIALLVRYNGRDFISSDMKYFLLKWYDIIKSGGGLNALNKQVGNYGLLYQTIISGFVYTDVKPVYCYKIISVIFDFLVAGSISYFVAGFQKNAFHKKRFCYAYAIVLLLPTVVMNSAYWGQCDSIYTFFVLWSIWFLYKQKYQSAFAMLGLAFGFKFQTILIIPLFIILYFVKKSFSILNFLITLFVFWCSGSVAYLYGRGIFEPFHIYFNQIGYYKQMYLNVTSFWLLGGNNYNYLHSYAIMLTIAILGTGLYMAVSKYNKFESFVSLLSASVFVEWTCILFLPAMHERYTYVLDLLLVALALIDNKYIKYAFVSLVFSIITYNKFLFGGAIIDRWCVIAYLFAWLHYTYTYFVQETKTP